MLNEIIKYAFLVFGAALICKAYLLVPRSRKELSTRVFVSMIFEILGVASLVVSILVVILFFLNTDRKLPDKAVLSFLVVILLTIFQFIGTYRYYRLKFKGIETLLLEPEGKAPDLWLMKMPYGPPVRALHYKFEANGDLHYVKKYIQDGKIEILKRVIYDPANPSRSIPVPEKSQDKTKY